MFFLKIKQRFYNFSWCQFFWFLNFQSSKCSSLLMFSSGNVFFNPQVRKSWRKSRHCRWSCHWVHADWLWWQRCASSAIGNVTDGGVPTSSDGARGDRSLLLYIRWADRPLPDWILPGRLFLCRPKYRPLHRLPCSRLSPRCPLIRSITSETKQKCIKLTQTRLLSRTLAAIRRILDEIWLLSLFL